MVDRLKRILANGAVEEGSEFGWLAQTHQPRRQSRSILLRQSYGPVRGARVLNLLCISASSTISQIITTAALGGHEGRE